MLFSNFVGIVASWHDWEMHYSGDGLVSHMFMKMQQRILITSECSINIRLAAGLLSKNYFFAYIVSSALLFQGFLLESSHA